MHQPQYTPDPEPTLRTMSALHWVMAALSLVCSGIMPAYLAWLSKLVESSPSASTQAVDMSSTTIQVVGAIVMYFAIAAINVVAALNVKQRKGYVWIMAATCANVLHCPIGTGIAIYAFMQLIKPEIQAALGEAPKRGGTSYTPPPYETPQPPKNDDTPKMEI